MKLIFCLEKGKGMMFFGKRHSQDSNLRARLMELTAGTIFWMSLYSAKQFSEYDSITADDDYMRKAGVDDYCFVEDKPYSIDGVSEIVLCHWNRKYPSDKFFDVDLRTEGYKKYSTEDIAGSSHEKITIEVWRREL